MKYIEKHLTMAEILPVMRIPLRYLKTISWFGWLFLSKWVPKSFYVRQLYKVQDNIISNSKKVSNTALGISNNLCCLCCNAVEICISSSCILEDNKTNEITDQDSGLWLAWFFIN